MERKNRWSFLPAALFSALLAVSLTGCLVTAFDLSLLQGMPRLALLCGLFALAAAFTFQLCHTAVPATLLAAALLLLFYQSSRQPLQMLTLLPSITRCYHNAYGWPILLENPLAAIGADLACLQLALILCFFLCWVLVRRKSLPLTLLPLSPILCCVVVTDTVPEPAYLALFLFGCICLLLTQAARRADRPGWGRLALRVTPAAALFLALLFLLTPQTGSLNPLRSYAETLLPWIEGLVPDGTGSHVGPSTDLTLDLSGLGPKLQSHTIVLYATPSHSGRTYLRHKVMTLYTGTSWQPLLTRSETFGSYPAEATASILIETQQLLSYRYMPYYPTERLLLSKGVLPNSENETLYRYSLTDALPTVAGAVPDAGTYQNLPDNTLAWAQPLAEDLAGAATEPAEIAARIAAYVQSVASYSLNTSRMPAQSKDFAQWFLERSDTGYCVHFATAATVLLRAAGVNARYAEGLTFLGEAGQRTAVTNAHAHAWVEYYDTAAGTWRILDPTPASGIPGDTPSADPDDPDIPDSPDTPEDPDTPDDPDTPETPDVPDTPDDPGQVPDTPDMTPDDYVGTGLWAWLTQLSPAALTSMGGGVLLLLLLLQWQLRKGCHRRRWIRGSANQQALERFRQCSMLTRALGVPLPEAAAALAGKARYSRHTLTAEELALFDDCLRQLRLAARAVPLYRRLICALIVAV